MRRIVVIAVISLLALTVLACSKPEPDPRIAQNAATIKALEEVVSVFRREVRDQAEEQEANWQSTLDERLAATVDHEETRPAVGAAQRHYGQGGISYDSFHDRLEKLEAAVKKLHQHTASLIPPETGFMGVVDWDPQALDERLAELGNMPQRLTAETATTDQAAVVNAAGCLSQWESGIPVDKAEQLVWAEAGASESDRDLIDLLMEQCSVPLMAQTMLASIVGMVAGSGILPTGGLTAENPLAVRLAGCLIEDDAYGGNGQAEMVVLYLNLIPEAAREAAVNLYCAALP